MSGERKGRRWLAVGALLALASWSGAQEVRPDPAATASPSQVEESRDKGILAYRDGNLALAEQAFRRYYEAIGNDQASLFDAVELLAKTLLAEGKFDDALTLLAGVPDRAAKLNLPPGGKLAPVHLATLDYWRAEALRRSGKPAQAIPLLQTLLKDRHYPPARVWLGLAEAHLALKEWDKAQETANRAIASGSSEEARQARLLVVRALFLQGHFQECLLAIDRIRSEFFGPGALDLDMLRVAAMLSLNKPSEALEFSRQAFARATDYVAREEHVQIMRRLAGALAASGHPADAAGVYERILPLIGQESWRQQVLLEWAELAATVNPRQAIDLYQRFLKLYPQDGRRRQVLFAQAHVYQTLKDLDQALALYDTLVQDPDCPAGLRYEAGFNAALLQREEKKDFERAIALFQTVAGLTVDRLKAARARIALADTYFGAEKFDQAVHFYTEVANDYKDTEFARRARFQQGTANLRIPIYPAAVDAFEEFLKQWPDDREYGEQTRFQKGIAEYSSGLNTDAMTSFSELQKKFPDSKLAPRALVEAANAAAAADFPSRAIDFLGTLLEKYPEAAEYPFGLYRRAYLRLSSGRYQEALEDSKLFLERYRQTQPQLAADVYLWLGDHYAGNQQYAEAEKTFLAVVEHYKESKDAPSALYEAAKNAYGYALAHDNDQATFDRALSYLERLKKDFPNASRRVQAQALFLHADVLSIRGQFPEAAAMFAAAAELVPASELHYAALGRQAECLYLNSSPKAEQRQQNQAQALQLLETVIAAPTGGDSLKVKARYRRAKILVEMQQTEAAKTELHDIFNTYRRQATMRLNWYYFSRAGFDLAQLYEQEKDYSGALRVLRIMAEADIPTAGDAREKMEQLRRLFGPE